MANNSLYIQAINKGELPFEKEILDSTNQYNEYVLTRLRTQWGIQMTDLEIMGLLNLISEQII